MFETLITAFSGPGAAFMYAITAALAFGLAVMFERCWMFWVRWKLNEPDIHQQLTSNDYPAAISSAGLHPVGNIIRAGAPTNDADSAWDAMATESALAENTVRRRVGWLSTISNIATMLGLLGTVYGLILAFSGLEQASAVERTARLSSGIGTAMATTAWGLLVGIPAMAAHALLEGRVARILASCEAIAARLALSKRS